MFEKLAPNKRHNIFHKDIARVGSDEEFNKNKRVPLI
jgi:hypothetical protein